MRYRNDPSSVVLSLDRYGSLRCSGAYVANIKVVVIHSKRSGFSLTELMVVMVILGMLATAVALAMGGFADSARKTNAVTEIATYVNAIDAFYAVQGRYPTNDEGLAILATKSKLAPSGYIKKIKKDPWGNPYIYNAPGKTSPFEIVCYGADRKEGGADVDADISSENLEND